MLGYYGSVCTSRSQLGRWGRQSGVRRIQDHHTEQHSCDISNYVLKPCIHLFYEGVKTKGSRLLKRDSSCCGMINRKPHITRGARKDVSIRPLTLVIGCSRCEKFLSCIDLAEGRQIRALFLTRLGSRNWNCLTL